jgi:hypothetical protein
MKKIVRLTESDLVRMVKRIINESEDTLVDEIDTMLDNMGSDPGPLQMIINRIEQAGENVEDFVRKLRRNQSKFMRHLKRNLPKLKFTKRKPNFSIMDTPDY